MDPDVVQAERAPGADRVRDHGSDRQVDS
jgi:hypothetical protein